MSKFKNTEIGQIPVEWGVSRIDELFSTQQGKQVSKKNRIGDNQRPFLRTANVLWGRLDFTELDEMNFTQEEERKLALQYGDLLVCEGGDIGRTAMWRGEVEKCYYQNHLHRLRKKNDNIDEKFFQYWLMYAFAVENIYFGRANITTIPNLSKSRLGGLLSPVPTCSEQHKIAHVLSTIQAVIEKQGAIISTTTELKKALVHELLTKGLRGEKQKETEIGPVPESWAIVCLKEACEKPQYGFTDSASSKGNAKFLRITDIEEFGVNWNQVPYCKCPEDKINKYLLKSGDILFARIGATTGKSYIIRNPPRAVYASYLIRIRTKQSLEPGFLIYFFNSSEYWRQIDATKGDNLKKGVSGSLLSNLLIPLPDKREQRKIADILTKLDLKIEITVKKKTMLVSLFKSMLHQLMTGQIRVHEVEFDGLIEHTYAKTY